MVSLLIWVLVLGAVAYVVSKLPIPSPFREIAWVVLGVILIVALLGLVPGGPVVLR